MKKAFIIVCVCTLLLVLASPAFAASLTLRGVSGTVVSVGSNGADNYIEVKTSAGETLQLIVGADTRLLDRTNGTPITLNAIPAGAAFHAWARQPLTKSVPAQSYLHTMIVTLNENTANGFFLEVGSVAKDANGVHLTNAAGDLIVTLPPQLTVEAFAENGIQYISADTIGKGAQLMVWYDVVTMSLPAQATAAKALVFVGGQATVPSNPVVNVPSTGGALSVTCLALPLALALLGAYKFRRV